MKTLGGPFFTYRRACPYQIFLTSLKIKVIIIITFNIYRDNIVAMYCIFLIINNNIK